MWVSLIKSKTTVVLCRSFEYSIIQQLALELMKVSSIQESECCKTPWFRILNEHIISTTFTTTRVPIAWYINSKKTPGLKKNNYTLKISLRFVWGLDRWTTQKSVQLQCLYMKISVISRGLDIKSSN